VLAITLGNLAVLELELQRPERAVALHQRSLALLAGTGDRKSEALANARLGAALALLDRSSEARARVARAESLAAQSDAVVGKIVALEQAVVELSATRHALARGSHARAKDSVAWAKARIVDVERALVGDRAASEQSDDIRSTLRILKPLLAEVEQALAASDKTDA
jgi:hypothetical protein